MSGKNHIPTTGIALIAALMLASLLCTGCAKSSTKRWAQLSPLIQPTPVEDRDNSGSILNEATTSSPGQVSHNRSTAGSLR